MQLQQPVETPPQLLLSSRNTAASAYNMALTGPQESETYPTILRKIVSCW